MNILEHRTVYKPFEYPWAFDFFKVQQQMHWIPDEVPLHEDVKDWNHKLKPAERNLLTQIFRFFTTADTDVGEGYYDKIIPLFPKPELRMMMGAFANMEGVHQHAYSLLLDTVGMPESEYAAFGRYKEMAAKHDYLQKFNPKSNSKREIARTLAVYSAFTEGMQLFSSFAILMNFPRFGKMKGMGQIVTWSLRDESLHCEGMIRVFRTFIEENPKIWNSEFKRELYEIAKSMVDLEDQFIDLAFSQGGVEGLEPNEVKTYIRYIADRRLNQIGLKSNYNIPKNPLEWVDWAAGGKEHANFFETRATEYAKGSLSGSWSDVWSPKE